jgi:hypothetical protein
MTAGAETFTVTEPEDVRQALLPLYQAVMVLTPTVNWLPSTESDAVAAPAEPVRLAAPNAVLPSSKATEPVGVVLPSPALTVAVSMVLPLAPMLAGSAAATVVVAVTGTLTFTVTDPEEERKPEVAA